MATPDDFLTSTYTIESVVSHSMAVSAFMPSSSVTISEQLPFHITQYTAEVAIGHRIKIRLTFFYTMKVYPHSIRISITL